MPSSLLKKPSISTLTLMLLLGFSNQSQAQTSSYAEALKLFKSKQYQAAYHKFATLSEADYTSQNINFYLARSATLTNRLDEAIITYERILILNPGNTRSKLELGRLYYKSGSYALSESYFKQALADNVPRQVEENIQQYLAAIKQKKNKSSMTAAVILGVGFDSNINTAPSAASWYIPAFGLDFENATDAIENSFHQQTVILNHYHNSTEELGFAIKNTLLAYSKAYPGESDYNILYGQYSPALVFAEQHKRTELALEFSHMDYGGQSYLSIYGVKPKVTFQPDASETVSLQAKLQKKNYQQTAKKQRNSVFSELSMRYQKLAGAELNWSVKVALQSESKDKGDLYDVDYQSASAQTGINYLLSANTKLGASLKIEQKNYQDASPFFYDQRQDNRRKASLELTQRVGKNLSVQALVERSINRSNHQPFEYDKNAMALNLISRF